MYGRIPSPKQSREWLSMNSFAARLHSEGLVDATCLGLHVLRSALEEENPVREPANCKISAASEWIIRTGVEFYREVRNPDPLHKDKSYLQATGSLYKGRPGFCQERWQFWKLRFSKVKDEVDKEVTEMVQQAVGAMEKAEKVAVKLKRDLGPSVDLSNRPFKLPRTALQNERERMEERNAMLDFSNLEGRYVGI
jgi:hypothetical protein